MSHWRRILVVCPHLDDELWSAALLARELEAGAMVSVAYLTEMGYRNVDDEVLAKENEYAVTLLGGHVYRHEQYLRSYRLDENPSAVREAIYDAIEGSWTLARPDLVLLPSSLDWHQDHRCAHRQGVTIAWRRDCDILGYVVPGTVRPSNAIAAHVTAEHLDIKQGMIDCYQSQAFRGRTEAGAEEIYEPIRWRL